MAPGCFAINGGKDMSELSVNFDVNDIRLRLIDALDLVVTSGGYGEFLKFAARLPSYSPRNSLLIFSQAKEKGFTPTIVMGYKGWLSRGRHVRRGEKGLRICVPVIAKERGNFDSKEVEVVKYFRSASVFDLSQTDGEAISEPLVPIFLEGEADEILLDLCVSEVERLGFSFYFGELAGSNGQTNFGDRTVVVSRNLPPRQRVKTALHELAHATMHHRSDIAVSAAELEAESAAYLILGSLGIASEDFSVPYLVRWSKGDTQEVAEASLRVVDFVVNFLRLYQARIVDQASDGSTLEGQVA
ncbi:MAG: DUF1738 domain-containing protein [Acidimicrobiaceae bacterium]|nr:DUF1738 domain-containing protein [Acidimicrobiaceae bacterium]